MAGKIEDAQNKIKKNNFLIEAYNKVTDLTNCGLNLDKKINDIKMSIDSLSLQTSKDIENLDKKLMELNDELKSLPHDEISNEMKLLNKVCTDNNLIIILYN